MTNHKELEESPLPFYDVEVDVGGYGIVWSDELDLSCDELFENGETVETPFDGLMAFTDATELWGLNEYAPQGDFLRKINKRN